MESRVIVGGDGVTSSLVSIVKEYDSIYNNFLNTIESSVDVMPGQQMQAFSNPLIKRLVDLGFTDLLNIPQANNGNELLSIYGPSFIVSGGQNGSLWDKEGKLVTGLAGGPRYTFDPSEIGKYEGVYVEVEKTNFWENSQGTTLKTTPWGDFNCFEIQNNFINQITFNGEHFCHCLVKRLDGLEVSLSGSGSDGDLVVFTNGSSSTFNSNIKHIGKGWYYFDRSRDTATQEVTRFQNNSGNKIFVTLIDHQQGLTATSIINTTGHRLTRPADTYTANNLINPTNPYTKFFIKNGDNIAEYYENGNKHTYINGVLDSTISESPNTDWVISSEGSDKYSCFALREGNITENELIQVTNINTEYDNSNIIILTGETYNPHYTAFLNTVDEPVKAVRDYSNPIVGNLFQLGYTDFLNIPQANIDDELPSIFGPSLFVSGGENGSRWDKDGKLITSLPNNRPRYTFNPVTGLYEGVYIEVEDENLLLGSNDFNNSTFWSKTNINVLGTDLNSPESDNAIKVERSDSFPRFTQNISGLEAESILQLSIFVKKGSENTFTFDSRQNTLEQGVLSRRISFNLDTKIILGQEDTFMNYGTEEINNEWFFIFTDYKLQNLTINFLSLWVWPARFTGDSTPVTMFLYGAKVGRKNNPLTSYIKTESTPLTRPADTYTANNLINISNPYTLFYIKNNNKIAEYYANDNKYTYTNGVLTDTISQAPSTDLVIDSNGSDKLGCVALKEGSNTENELIQVTSN